MKDKKDSIINIREVGEELNKLRKIPWALGKQAFLVIIICVLLEVALGCILVYKYTALLEGEVSKTVEMPVKFNETAYQAVLQYWETRSEKFSALADQVYLDPFQK